MTTAVTPSNQALPAGHVPEPAFNSLMVAMLLTAAGGFLDAFSYLGQGHVFANVMTGNLVLSAISSVRSDWTHVARLLLPLASYVAGASTGAMLRSSAQKRMIAAPQVLALGIEIAILAGIGWLPQGFSSAAIVSTISFLIAVRSCFFSHVEAWTYASTMPTGNLRQFGEAVFQSLSGTGNPKSKRQATVFALVTLSFFLGALTGVVATNILHNRAIWIGGLFLLAALVCGLEHRPPALSTVASSVCFIGILALLSVTSARAQTPQDAAPVCPGHSTTLPVTTYDEDVKYLADRECQTGDILAPLQYIPLRGEDENYYLSFGFWIRERGDYVSNPNWSNRPSGNVDLMQRYLAHVDLHLGEFFRFFGELASSVENGRNGGPRPGLDDEKLYVHQGFFDVGVLRSGSDNLTLRAGRQEIALGSENLVSTRDGRNIRNSFDGVRLTWVKRDWTVDAFALKPVLNNSGYFDDPPSHGSSFWGLYAVHPLRLLPHGSIDLYYMGLDNQSVPFEGKGTGREQRETVGTRLWGSTQHWDYNDEFAFQFGSFRSDEIRAWAVSTEHGYRIESKPLQPRFGLRALALSGDRNPSSHTVGTFNSMFEQGPYFSYAELFARRNLIALQPSAEVNLTKSVSWRFNPAFFWRESTSDGLYSIGNSVIVSGLNSDARYIATQVSTQLRWRMNRNLTWFTEFGHFSPGEFLKQATPGRNLNYWTAWLDIRY
jgi:uncharacterized membrane protein YoaK (UPF0700 family)